jgi:hypothetical protein
MPWCLGVPAATSVLKIAGETNAKHNGKWIAMGTKRGAVFLYDKTTMELIHTVEILEENGSGPAVAAVEIIPVPEQGENGRRGEVWRLVTAKSIN